MMAAMEAADANGGDHRCNCGNNPLEFVPCGGKTAHVAHRHCRDGHTRGDPQRWEMHAYLSVTDDNTQRARSLGQ